MTPKILGFTPGSNAGFTPDPTPAENAAEAAEYFCAADLHGLPIPARHWHVPDFIPAGTVTTLNGDGGAGKSLADLSPGDGRATGLAGTSNMHVNSSVVPTRPAGCLPKLGQVLTTDWKMPRF